MDEAVSLVEDDDRYVPDFVLYTGGSIVSKRWKRFLRKAKETWLVNESGEVTDPFMNLTHVFMGDHAVVADQIRFMLEQQPHPFVQLWNELLERVHRHALAYMPAYSQMATVKYFNSQLSSLNSQLSSLHYANSTAVRLANIYACHPFYCNRGVNGIDGSLSTAAGYSLVTDDLVFCVIGDLSFFYDQNALWNKSLRGNFRILLMNNGKGGIFNMLQGLEQSPARDKYVAAEHHTSAKGICEQNDVVYMRAENMVEMQDGIDRLLQEQSDRPMLLEVFTDAAEDERVYRDYYIKLKN
jgi:2-succinyl-5-enolpyruvyl-6-hydroxy-3-cyclohexene-1-carboxylate synthase